MQLITLAGVLAPALPGGPHAGDVALTVEDGVLVTNARVFEAVFGDSGCGPFTANPGFDTLPGTFAVGTKLGWNAVSGWQTWNGAGFEPSGGEFLDISFSTLGFEVHDGPTTGFELFVQQNGGFHVHVDFCMDGCPNICAPTGADPGIYLLELEMYSTDPDIEPSAPFRIVFNYLDSTENLNEAGAWVEQVLCADACVGDVDGDQDVDVDDLVAIIVAFGNLGVSPADINGDLVVDVNDLVDVIVAWGDCD